MSSRAKLTLWISGMMVLMFIISMSLFLYADRFVIGESPKTKIVDFVWDNSKLIAYNDGEFDFKQAEAKHKGAFCSFYDGSGAFIGGATPKDFDGSEVSFVSSELRTVRQAQTDYLVYDLHRGSGDSSIWLRGVIPLTTTHGMLLKLINIAFFLLTPVIIIGVFGADLIYKRTFMPIKMLTTKASEIADNGNLSERVILDKSSPEIRELTSTVNNMFSRLQNSLESEKQFVSDASHELRTPTTIILAECSRAKKKARTKEDYDSSIAVIEEQGNKMKQMISQLLAMTRLDQGGERIRLQESDFSAFVAVCCEEFAPRERRGISFRTKINPNIMVAFDAGLMFRVIQNLLENAYKYGNENGNIFLSLTQKENWAILSVTDDGIGIAPEDQQDIFKRFWQADSSRSEDQGVGLGLAIVQQICRFHGGAISVKSELGKGSSFIVTLPAKRQ